MSIPVVIISIDVVITKEEHDLLMQFFSHYGIKLMAHDAATKKLMGEAAKIKSNIPFVDEQGVNNENFL